MAHAGGRPRLAGRRPTCPFGHAGAVWFDGFRKRRTDSLYARPLSRCVHIGRCDASCRSNCDGQHRFSGAEQARTHSHPDGLWCRECDRERSLRDGTPVAHAWDFEARLIADALIAVGAGASYRDASERMRLAARRFAPGVGVPIVSRSGETVARYLDHFGELVVKQVEHDGWPEVLLLDALPFRKREVIAGDPFSFEVSGNGAVLVAYGYVGPFPTRKRRRVGEDGALEQVVARPRMRAHAWRISVAGGVDRFSWFDFLSALPGMPRWIVVDGDSAVRAAVLMRWGSGPDAPIVFSCEGHLAEKFRDRALTEDNRTGVEVWDLWPEHRRGDPAPPRGPLWTPDDYRSLLDKVLAHPPHEVRAISSWIRGHDRTIRHQFALRADYPGLPRGTGALEAGLVKIRDWLGDRPRSFQNVRRMNVMFGLIRANLGGHADPALYSRVIRAELDRTNGRPKLDWRRHHLAHPVASGHAPPGSLFRLADDARDTALAGRRAYWVSAQASTMAKKAAILNDYHFLVGAPPIELTSARTPAVKLRGRKVSDFPTFLDEWDPGNTLDPYTTPAGSGEEVTWICANVPSHRWPDRICDRLVRLLGCPTCNRVRGIAAHEPAKNDSQSLRDRLTAIRSAWGPYEAPLPIPAPAAWSPAAALAVGVVARPALDVPDEEAF